jgi:hypothetical protein
MAGKVVRDSKWSPKLTKRGLPKRLPIEIRKFLWDYRECIRTGVWGKEKHISRKVSNDGPFGFTINIMENLSLGWISFDSFRFDLTFKLLSSVLCFFRACCPTGKVRVSYNSIILPPTGKKTTFDDQQIIYGLSSLGVKPLRVMPPRILRPSSKAGPNGTNAILSLG